MWQMKLVTVCIKYGEAELFRRFRNGMCSDFTVHCIRYLAMFHIENELVFRCAQVQFQSDSIRLQSALHLMKCFWHSIETFCGFLKRFCL